MGDLRPLGSEKLQGTDKLKRIMEIARYNETDRSELNESNSVEYQRQLADGKYYGIVFEKNGYIIKSGLNESEMDYNEPMANRKYMSSYSKALKKFNLMAAELNRLHENEEGLNLFGEQEKKFVLKTPKPEAPAVEPEMDLDLSASADSDMGGEDLDLDLGLDTPEGEEEMDLDLDMDMEPEMDQEMDDQEEEVSIKVIQKLTGKLGQKLRTIDSQEGLTSEDIKYVLNSIISAIDLDKLSEEDKEDILANFEEDEIDYGVDDEADLDVDAGDELDLDMDFDLGDEEPEAEMGEMKEDYDDMFLSIGDQPWFNRNDSEYKGEFDFDYDEEEIEDFDDLMSRYGAKQKWFRPDDSDKRDLGMSSSGRRMFDMYKEKYGQPFKLRKRRNMDMGGKLMDEIFSESKIDKVLSKYFVVSEEEKVMSEQKNIKRFIAEKVQKVTVRKEMKSMCETVEQEMTADFLLRENSDIKFLGKTNKGNLVFENEGQQIKVSQKGELL